MAVTPPQAYFMMHWSAYVFEIFVYGTNAVILPETETSVWTARFLRGRPANSVQHDWAKGHFNK